MAYIETIVECYLLATPRCDIDLLMNYYHSDAVLFTPEGVHEGKMAIRVYFTQFYGNPPSGYPEQFELLRKEIKGDTAYLVWRCGDSVPYATDTLCLEKGLVRNHTIAAYIPILDRHADQT